MPRDAGLDGAGPLLPLGGQVPGSYELDAADEDPQTVHGDVTTIAVEERADKLVASDPPGPARTSLLERGAK